MISVSKDMDAIVTVKNEKQKDDAQFAAISLALTTVTIGLSGDGHSVTSCVLEPTTTKAKRAERDAELNSQKLDALRALQQIGIGQTKEWRTATETKRGRAVSEHTFEKWRKALCDEGLVEAVGATVPRRYGLTDKGASAIDGSLAGVEERPTSVSHAITPEGVAGRAGCQPRDAA